MFNTLSSSRWESKASDPWPHCSTMLSTSSIHKRHALIGYMCPHTLGLGFYGWVVLLSHAVMSVMQVFPSLWYWVWLVLVLRVLVFHLLRCEVTVVTFDALVWAWVGMVETVGIRQLMWIVMLEAAKDRILGVDTPGQQVPPHVQYGTVLAP
jgi:hypothetical protein